MLDSVTERFPAGQIISSPDVLFSMKDGNPITYPFDVYSADFFITGLWWNPDLNDT